jgi:hypothetical protein
MAFQGQVFFVKDQGDFALRAFLGVSAIIALQES